MKLIKDKKIVMIILSIILVIIVMSSTTYALFFKTHTLDNTESYTAGILDITVEEGSKLSLTNTLPMTDEEGAKTTPYTFTITNNGNISYKFDLKMLSTTTSNQINSKYIKVKLDDNEPVLLSSISSGIIADDLKLDPEKSVTMSVRIWLDINTPNTEIGKKFSAKIVTDGVGSEYVPPGAIVIKQIFDNSVKTTVTDNNQNYEYAKDIFGTDKGGMMKDVGDNIRYYGPNPNNYVSFNNELWRIIGVFNDIDDGTGKKEIRLKIVRNDYSNSVQWSGNGTNEWTTSSLKDLLNLDTSGNFYYTLTQTSKNMISNAVWYLGAASGSYSYLYADQYYKGERENAPFYPDRSESWTGKIALIYASDYMYSSDLSKCNDAGWGSNSNCVNLAWVANGGYDQWTITPYGGNYEVDMIYSNGTVGNTQSGVFSSGYYRPVVYLKSTVQITGGDGTQSNPYILG